MPWGGEGCNTEAVAKYDLSEVDLQLYWNHTPSWVFSCKFAAYFQNTFSEEHLWRVASGYTPSLMLLTTMSDLHKILSEKILKYHSVAQ